MFELKPLSKDAIARSLDKAVRYRLLNQPVDAESICLDILEIEPDNQKAIITLILSVTDQFERGKKISAKVKQATELLPRLDDEYVREYYTGIINERRAKAVLQRGTPGCEHDAYDWFRDAMDHFEKAIKIKPSGNDDAILRWNGCVRMINRNKLEPRKEERVEPYLE